MFDIDEVDGIEDIISKLKALECFLKNVHDCNDIIATPGDIATIERRTALEKKLCSIVEITPMIHSVIMNVDQLVNLSNVTIIPAAARALRAHGYSLDVIATGGSKKVLITLTTSVGKIVLWEDGEHTEFLAKYVLHNVTMQDLAFPVKTTLWGKILRFFNYI